MGWIWPKPPWLGWLNWPCRLSGQAGLCAAMAEKQVGCFGLPCWAGLSKEENGGREAARSVHHNSGKRSAARRGGFSTEPGGVVAVGPEWLRAGDAIRVVDWEGCGVTTVIKGLFG
jgi:hypothetical protein